MINYSLSRIQATEGKAMRTTGLVKFENHRAKAMAGTKKKPAMSKAEYSQLIGLRPQRVAGLLKGKTPSLEEALTMADVLKIQPRDWLRPAKAAA
jgi:hypothetical protein